MQLMNYRRQISLSLTLAFATIAITPNASAFPCEPQTLKKAAAGTLLFATLACFFRLVSKETQPKRVYPKDDSFSETAWYVFDELLAGQMEKGERPARVIIEDPENPTELTIKYSKIEPRGVAGIIYSSMKPIIIPTLTLMLLFNKDFLEKVRDSIFDTHRFIEDPAQPINMIVDAITGPIPAKTPAPAKVN